MTWGVREGPWESSGSPFGFDQNLPQLTPGPSTGSQGRAHPPHLKELCWKELCIKGQLTHLGLLDALKPSPSLLPSPQRISYCTPLCKKKLGFPGC